MTRRIQVLINMIVLSFAVTAMAQKPIVYPAKGQSGAQQSKDDAECYAWAKQTTGIDPAVVASTPPPQQTGPAVGGGQRAAGAFRGAAGGAAIGAIAGDAGKGAGIGAIAGTMRGGMKQREAKATAKQQCAAKVSAEQKKEEEQLKLAHKEGRDAFQRAFGACMDAR